MDGKELVPTSRPLFAFERLILDRLGGWEIMSQILGKDVAQLKDQESIMVHDHWNINEKLD